MLYQMKMTERDFFSILITCLLNIILILKGEIMSRSLLGVHERVNKPNDSTQQDSNLGRTSITFSVLTDQLHLFLSLAFCITCTYVLKGNFYFSFLPIVSSVIA